MKAALPSVALCLALGSSLAHAQDLGLSSQLRLRDPIWADAAVGGEERPPAPQVAVQFQGVLGLLGGVAMIIPAGLAGYAIGDFILPPAPSCDPDGCDVGYPFGGALGALTGSIIGLAFGTGLGVASAGALQGGAFHLGHAVLGAGVGAVVAVAACIALSFVVGSFLSPFMPLLAAGMVITGAVVGSVWWYQESHPFREPAAPPAPSPAPAAPMVLLVRGGAVMQIAGTF